MPPRIRPKPTKPKGKGETQAGSRQRSAAERARVRARKPAEQKGEGAYQPRRPKPVSQESKATAATSLGKVRSGSDTGAVRIIMDSKLSDSEKRTALQILGKGKGGPKEG